MIVVSSLNVAFVTTRNERPMRCANICQRRYHACVERLQCAPPRFVEGTAFWWHRKKPKSHAT